MASTLSSLPFESWALIASQLEPVDRQCLAASCRTGHAAVSIVTATLVCPGSQLCSAQWRRLQCSTEKDVHHCSGADSWDYACCSACTNDDTARAKMSAGLCCNSPALLSAGYDSSIPISKQFGSWLQRYAGVRTLTLTSCDSCLCTSTAVPNAGLCLHTPCSPHTPTQTPSWASSCFSPSSCPSRIPQAPDASLAISLASFIAAAGGSMPYLQELDLSTACPCLHSQGGVLQAITASCPRLEALSLPTWLLQPPAPQPSGSFWTPCRSFSFSNPPRRSAAAAFWDHAPAAAAAEPPSSAPIEPYGFDRLLLHSQHLGDDSAPTSPQLCLPPLRRKAGARQQQQQHKEGAEQLGALAGLAQLTSLKLAGAAPPAAAVCLIAELTQLQTFALEVTDTLPNVPLALSELPGWQGSGLNAGDSRSGSPGAGGSSGAVLGASLTSLTRLTSLSLSGALHASDTLKAVSGLPQLVRVEIANLPDFAVASLANLSALTGLTALRVEGCRAPQATARSALPLQLHVLQELAVLELDFDLHLRDMQVLCLLKRLSHLTANSFHHCIHLMTGLTLPALRFLRVAYVSRFALQQQQGLPPGYQLAQALAGPQMAAAAAAAAAVPAGAAAAGLLAPAAGVEGGIMEPPPPAAAAGVPVMPLSALPVLLNLQQQHHHHQQQQDEQPPFMLLAAPGGQALLVHHQPAQQGTVPAPLQLPAVGGHGSAPTFLPLQQHQLPQQQLGLPNRFNLQLLQLRQQQLHLQQQQLRLQQQQVRLQLQQMQAQIVQQAQHAPQLANGAALPYGAVQAAPAAAQQGQQQQVGVGAAAAAAAAAACAQPKGWLAVLFPGLEELHLTSSRDCAAAVPALQGHQALQKLVIGVRQSGQQQPGGLQAAGQPMAVAGGSNGMQFGGQAVGCGSGGSSRGVGAAWGVLKSVASLEELEIHDSAVVLGTTPWTLGVALSGQLCRLVLRGAGPLSDLSAATLLGPYTWSKLTHLEIQGAEVLSNRGLNCFVSLPYLQRLSLSHCPAVTGCGLASFLLSASSSMRHVDLLCCAGVRPAEAQAVQDAVWSITHRRVDVSWSRHDTMQARF